MYRAVDLVQWLRENTQVQEVMGSNPSTGHWMDIFYTNLNYLFEKTEDKLKRGRECP